MRDSAALQMREEGRGGRAFLRVCAKMRRESGKGGLGDGLKTEETIHSHNKSEYTLIWLPPSLSPYFACSPARPSSHFQYVTAMQPARPRERPDGCGGVGDRGCSHRCCGQGLSRSRSKLTHRHVLVHLEGGGQMRHIDRRLASTVRRPCQKRESVSNFVTYTRAAHQRKCRYL